MVLGIMSNFLMETQTTRELRDEHLDLSCHQPPLTLLWWKRRALPHDSQVEVEVWVPHLAPANTVLAERGRGA